MTIGQIGLSARWNRLCDATNGQKAYRRAALFQNLNLDVGHPYADVASYGRLTNLSLLAPAMAARTWSIVA